MGWKIQPPQILMIPHYLSQGMTPQGPPNRGSNSDWGHSLTVNDALQGLRINFKLIIYKKIMIKIYTTHFLYDDA